MDVILRGRRHWMQVWQQCAHLSKAARLGHNNAVAVGALSHPGIKQVNVESSGRRLAVKFKDGTESLYSSIWLRDSCANPACRTANGQRLFETEFLSEAQTTIAAAEYSPATDEISLNWEGCINGAAQSLFSSSWLKQHSASKEHVKQRESLAHLFELQWDNRLPQLEGLPTAEYSHVTGTPEDQHLFLRQLRRFGFVIVQNAPVDDNTVLHVGNSIGFVRHTNYGDAFNVEAKPNPNNLAYTTAALPVHTDNPYRNPTPGIQLLHCQVPASDGGNTILVDGFAAAEHLRSTNPHAFEVLSTTRRPYRYIDKERMTDLQAESYPITIQGNRVVSVHINNRSSAPIDNLDADRIDEFYEAMRCYLDIIESPQFRVEVKLDAGQILVFANNRVLHGRTSWTANCHRKLQGAYVDSDELWSRLNALENSPNSTSKDLRADDILAMVALGRDQEYGENVNMLTHSLQAAKLASDSGASSETVVAALCHDIGLGAPIPHIIGAFKQQWEVTDASGGVIGVKEHHDLGYHYMRYMRVPEDVATLVKGHVDAKRYLVTVDESYLTKLSEASVGTLHEQGGPMAADEANAFRSHHLAQVMLQMRAWDDEAKCPRMDVHPLWSYRSLVAEILL